MNKKNETKQDANIFEVRLINDDVEFTAKEALPEQYCVYDEDGNCTGGDWCVIDLKV